MAPIIRRPSSSPSWSALKRPSHDLRQSPRINVQASVRAAWVDSHGDLRMSHARVLNISERGMAIELPQQPMRNGMVRIQSERFKVSACGSVRHILPVGGRFIVGLELPPEVKLPVHAIPVPAELAIHSDSAMHHVDKETVTGQSPADDWFSKFAASLDSEPS